MNLKKYQSGYLYRCRCCPFGAAAFCGYHIYHHYAQVEQQTEAFEEIAEVVENAPAEEENQKTNLSARARIFWRNTKSCICRMRIWSVGFHCRHDDQLSFMQSKTTRISI